MSKHRTPIARLAPRRLWVFALLLGISGVALGEEPRLFTVEVIIFEHAGAAAKQTEIWREPDADGAAEPAIRLDALTNAAVPRPPLGEAALFEPVPSTEYQLKSEARALKRSARYNVLLHTAWRQPGLAPEHAIAVDIDQPLGSEPAETPTATGSSLTPSGSGPYTAPASQTDTAVEPKARQRLEGSLRLHLSRYLHLAVDLTYFNGDMTTPEHQFLSDALAVEVVPLSFHLQESRRLRSGELHYFDHPVLGVVALVTPYEPPQPEVVPPEPEPSAAPAPPATAGGDTER